MARSAENNLGKWGATSYFVGSIVGSGIFITPTSILNKTGSVGLSLVIWLLSAAATSLGAYCYIELGTGVRRSGGDFAYLSYVKCRSLAFMFMVVGCVLIYPLMIAIQANTFAEYSLQGLGLPPLSSANSSPGAFILRKLVAFSALWLLLFLNFFSLRVVVAPFQLVTSVAKFLSALLIVGIGVYWLAFWGYTDNLHEPFANSSLGVGQISTAFFAGLFNYEGWDVLNYGVEELDNPESTMPFAIFLGMSCIALFYLAINISYHIVLNVADIQQSAAVAITFAERTMGSFANVMPFIITLVLLNAMNATMFAASRYLFAAARERRLPSFIACVNRRHDSPRAALIVHVLIVFVLSFLGDVDELIDYLGFAIWLQRGCTMCALLYIRFRHLPVHPGIVKVPLVLPLVFLAICFSLAIVTIVQDFGTAYVGLSIMATALAIYALFIWERALPSFAWYREASSSVNDFLAQMTQIALNGQIDMADPETEEAEDPESVVRKRRAATLTLSHSNSNDEDAKRQKSNRIWPKERDMAVAKDK